ncbi:MAG: anti-sigma factor antagonist [Bryobacterales bacterium]|jgi:anti-sigma B factor antagonist|nr:anti-sigma factor antagonist [Bryobacterales bacterium]
MNCRMEPIQREQIIAKYLSRSLDSEGVEEFEGHYLGCDECFDELRVSEHMAAELRISPAASSNLAWKHSSGVSVLQFRSNAELTHKANTLEELRREVLEQSDSRVIIDLARVTKIDSAGLGQLMSCYSHLVRNQGSLKVVNATPEIKDLMDMTGISTLIPAFSSEQEAMKSFKN